MLICFEKKCPELTYEDDGQPLCPHYTPAGMEARTRQGFCGFLPPEKVEEKKGRVGQQKQRKVRTPKPED